MQLEEKEDVIALLSVKKEELRRQLEEREFELHKVDLLLLLIHSTFPTKPVSHQCITLKTLAQTLILELLYPMEDSFGPHF